MIRCFRCGNGAAWQQRIAIPAKGSRAIERWLYTGHDACLEHRKAGITPAELMTEADKEAITKSMAPLEPDFGRAFLEWATI